MRFDVEFDDEVIAVKIDWMYCEVSDPCGRVRHLKLDLEQRESRRGIALR